MTKSNVQDGTTVSESKRAADDLFQVFADMINTGELLEGETLPSEREIVSTYGVSRTVVRETILALANKGLVKARPRYRPVVRKPSYETALETVDNVVHRLLNQQGGVKNLFDTRILVEVALVRHAAIEAQKDDISDLKNALQSNESAIEDSDKFYETDIAFHQVLYKIPRNPVLPVVHKAYTTWLAPHWSIMPRLPDRNLKNFKAHKNVFDSILLRDPDAAELALRQHLEDAWDQVRQTFGDI